MQMSLTLDYAEGVHKEVLVLVESHWQRAVRSGRDVEAEMLRHNLNRLRTDEQAAVRESLAWAG